MTTTAVLRTPASFLMVKSRLMLPLAAAALGLAAFAGPWPLLALSALMPLLLASASSRGEAFILVLIYQLAASRGLAAGASQYFKSPIVFGAVIWAVAAVVSAAVYGLLWHRQANLRALGFVTALTLLAVPPLGAVGLASPLSAAGVLFPGLKIYGLILVTLLMLALAAQRLSVAAALLAASLVANAHYLPLDPGKVYAVSTTYGAEAASFETDYQRQVELAAVAAAAPEDVVLFPEGSLREWNDASQKLWQRLLPGGKTLIIGTTLPPSTEHKAVNVQVVNAASGSTIYPQRQPVPLSMWKPWSKDGFEASWQAAPVIEASGVRAARLICYEAFLVWPALTSLGSGAGELIVSANLWWAKGTSIPALQLALAASWARLFAVPLTAAVNT